jgi:hypothetical protein
VGISFEREYCEMEIHLLHTEYCLPPDPHCRHATSSEHLLQCLAPMLPKMVPGRGHSGSGSGRGQPLQFTLSSGEIPWFDEQGEMRRCDWSEPRFFVYAQYELPGYGFLFSQSRRRISPFSSNHGISPNDSVNYSCWPPSHGRRQRSVWSRRTSISQRTLNPKPYTSNPQPYNSKS